LRELHLSHLEAESLARAREGAEPVADASVKVLQLSLRQVRHIYIYIYMIHPSINTHTLYNTTREEAEPVADASVKVLQLSALI